MIYYNRCNIKIYKKCKNNKIYKNKINIKKINFDEKKI